MEINSVSSLDERSKLLLVDSARVHFSQLGEDCLLWHHFHSIFGGFYVDVGCHHPTRYSNTYLLHHYRQWRGINIDPDPRAIARFEEARPGDVNLAIGVGASSGVRNLSMFRDGAVNTFDPAVAREQAVTFGSPANSTVSIQTLADILSTNVPPGVEVDYLDVDCEGLDHEVLVSNDWKSFRPKVITVELFGLALENPMSNQTVAFLKEKGYRLISYCHATAFFRR